MQHAVPAIGLVRAAGGLALALAPSRIVVLPARFAVLPPDRRRMTGLAALATGVIPVWLARRLGV